MKRLLIKIAEIIFYRKKVIIFIWLLLIVISILLLFFNKYDNSEAELSGLFNSEAYTVKKILTKDFNFKTGNTAAIAIDGHTDITGLKEDVRKNFKEISRVTEVLSNKTHNHQLLFIEFDPVYPNIIGQRLTPVLRKHLVKWQTEHNTKAYVTGNTAFQYDSNASGKDDSKKGEAFALIIAFFVLIFTFGGLLSAFLPLLIGITTLIYLHGFINLMRFPVNIISQILTGLVGLALAIDYSLFILSRFKEEILIHDNRQAIINTLLTAGKTILFSGLIMLCSISVLFIPDVSLTKTVVSNMMLVIVISLINSLIFLPAFLLIGKKYLDSPVIISGLINNSDKYNFWKKFSTHIVKYPKLYFLLSLSLLILFSAPLVNIKLWSPVVNIAPSDSESIQGYNLLEKDGWGGELVPVNIVIKADKSNIYSKEFVSYVYDLTKELEKNTSVQNIQSITSWNKNYSKNDYFAYLNIINNLSFFSLNNQVNPLVNNQDNLTLINVFPKNLVSLNDTFAIINFVRDYAKKHPQFQVLTGGTVARINDFTIELYSYIPQMFFIIFFGIYILLFFHMRSVILPLKAGIMNFLPILSSFGIVTIIFQYGYFHEFLHTPFNHAVTNVVPVVLFCVVFGLSMDYEVLILSRISEIYYESKDVDKAIIEGTAKSSSLITGAALILGGVFMPGIFSSAPQIKEICIGMTSAIFIDATIVRLLLVPSFMKLMGEWNWWNPFSKN